MQVFVLGCFMIADPWTVRLLEVVMLETRLQLG
jgi:hypothetical protein